MTTCLRYPKGYQFFVPDARPAVFGQLTYYQAGTTALQATYSDAAGGVPNTNPVVLDASGRLEVDIYLASGNSYKEVLADSGGALIAPWPDDNIPAAQEALANVAYSGSYADLINTPRTNTAFTGDSGTGGVAGLVPAPPAGAATANKFLSASGEWTTPPVSQSSITVTATTSAATASGSTLTFASVPSTVTAGMLVQDATTQSVIPAGTTVSAATGTTVTLSAAVAGAGVASGDSINFYGSGANTTNLTVSKTSNSVSVSSSTGSGATIPAATASVAGVLDAARAAKVDGLATVASSGSYSDLSNRPANFVGDSGTGGQAGFVPAPPAGSAASAEFLRADGSWAIPSGGSGGGGGGDYVLPAASVSVLGGVKIGSNVNVTGDGTISVAAQVQPNWTASSGMGQILNKPTLATVATSGSYADLLSKPSSFTPSAHASTHASGGSDAVSLAASQISGLATVATSGSYADLSSKPTIPAAQVNSDWNASSGLAQILNKPTLGSLALLNSLASTDLSDKTTAGTNMFTAANAAAQTALLSAMVGDSGSGGTKGLVPAPAAGDAAAGKYLKADGTWTAPAGGGGMTYPGAGIAVSTGSAWATSITPGTGVASALAVAVDAAGGLASKSSLATVATTGAYADLSGKPTLSLGGSFTTSGAYATTLTMTAATSLTLPTSGTLATTAQLLGSTFTPSGLGINLWIGPAAGNATLTGTGAQASYNLLASGNSCGQSLTTGYSNTIVGTGSASAITTANQNTIMGQGCATSMTTGYQNAFFGQGISTSLSGTGPYQNAAYGAGCLAALTSGYQNAVFGYNSGTGITTASANVIAGAASGNAITTGYGNVIVGGGSGTGVIGNSNIIVGYASGGGLTSGAGNTIVGNSLGSLGNPSNTLILGAGGTQLLVADTTTVRPQKPLKVPTYTVSGLPSASTAGAGTYAWVSDATVTVIGSIAAGGGSNAVQVISDGSNWRIGGPLSPASVIGAHGGTFSLLVLEDSVTLSGATTNSSIQIPAGAVVIGCAARVTTAVTGATSWSLGYSGSASSFGSSLGVSLGSTNVGNIGGQGFYSATNLLFTSAGGDFTGGVVRVMLYYLLATAPTS